MLYLNSVPVLNQVKPEDMAEEQKKDPILRLVCSYITAGENLKSLDHHVKINSKSVQKYLVTVFNRLIFKQAVLHCLYINNDVEYQSNEPPY